MRNPIRTTPFAILTCLAIFSFSLTGCGGSDGLPRQAVSGTVTLDGQPLADGSIQMIPADKKVGTAGGAVIKDGKYAIEREKGLVPGQYRVVISSAQGGGAAPAAGPPGTIAATDAAKELVPPQYNIESTLTADVKAGQTNTIPFDLKSK